MRVDSGVLAGAEITPLYDPMVAKLIVWDADREQATRRMARALEEFEIEGVETLIPFHKAIMASEQWAQGGDLPRPDRGPRVAQDARRSERAEARRTSEPEPLERTYTVEVSGKRFDVRVLGDAIAAPAANGAAPATRPPGRSASASARRRRRRRRRHARLAAAGQRLQGARRAGRRPSRRAR